MLTQVRLHGKYPRQMVNPEDAKAIRVYRLEHGAKALSTLLKRLPVIDVTTLEDATPFETPTSSTTPKTFEQTANRLGGN